MTKPNEVHLAIFRISFILKPTSIDLRFRSRCCLYSTVQKYKMMFQCETVGAVLFNKITTIYEVGYIRFVFYAFNTNLIYIRLDMIGQLTFNPFNIVGLDKNYVSLQHLVDSRSPIYLYVIFSMCYPEYDTARVFILRIICVCAHL